VTTSHTVTGYVFGGGSPCWGILKLLLMPARNGSDNPRATSAWIIQRYEYFFGRYGFPLWTGLEILVKIRILNRVISYAKVISGRLRTDGASFRLSRKLNEPGCKGLELCWSWVKEVQPCHGTWIAEVCEHPSLVWKTPNSSEFRMVFSNPPGRILLSLKLIIRKDQQGLRFEIYNEEGKLVAVVLENKRFNKGDNLFFFFQQCQLSQGINSCE